MVTMKLPIILRYNKATDYSPLRKSDLQPPSNCTNDELIAYFKCKRGKVSNAVKLALNVKFEKLKELRTAVVEENGLSCFADVIESLAKA